MDVSASTPDRVDSESMCLALGRYLPSHNETMEWMTERLRRRETSPMTNMPAGSAVPDASLGHSSLCIWC